MQFDFKTKTPVFQHRGFSMPFGMRRLIPQADYRLLFLSSHLQM